MKYDAFISYRRENGFLMAQVIYDRLRKKGINCFLDLEELRSGEFDEKIISIIRDADYFLLVLPKNALNRCADEKDWVRREIMAALENNKTIIPVMYDGFRWPKKWPGGIPEELKRIERMNGVSGTQEYLSAMIDKLVTFMPCIQAKALSDTRRTGDGNDSLEAVPLGTVDFFSHAFSCVDEIECIDMAFHAGAEWRSVTEKVEMLSWILEKKIRLRVLVNTDNEVGEIVKSMTQPLKKYISFDSCVEAWGELMESYPDLVTVRIANLPLLHRLYIVRGENGGEANVKFYTYGNYIPENDVRNAFKFGTREYMLYANEFDYLWDHSRGWNMVQSS